MKASGSVLFALAIKVIALPSESHTNDVANDDTEVGVMEFTGPLTPGAPDITLHGTAEEIYNQLIELSPEYSVWDFPEYADGLADEFDNTSANPEATIRDILLEEGLDRFECDKPPRIENPLSNRKCGEGLKYLRSLAGKCGVVGSQGSCHRVSCSNNCGMALCINRGTEIRVRCKSIAKDVERIVKECMDGENYSSGQLHHFTHHIRLYSKTC